MTFFEAALEVLRTAHRPLDYKTITQFAVSRQLLGHVGHTPDIVMASCLIRAVQRCETGALIRLETGEFALRGWPPEVLARVDEPTLPECVSSVQFPSVNVGLLDEKEALPHLDSDDIQFRKAVQLKFERSAFDAIDENDVIDDEVPPENLKYARLKNDLGAQNNEHFNMCAAIVKILRQSAAPMRAGVIALTLGQKIGASVYEQSIVLAMRADNALRVSRGKRAVFMHIPPDMWTLSENYIAGNILKLESKLYDTSRQIRMCSLHALASRLRELSLQAWLQLSALVMKHLNYTIISQCRDSGDAYVFRAEEARGLTYVPIVIKVLHKPLVETDDVIHFREQVRELGYDHGVIMINTEFSRDALNECLTKDTPIYAYSARQIAPIMLDARIGVVPHDLPVVFIDNDFFLALSTDNAEDKTEHSAPESDSSEEEAGESVSEVIMGEVYEEIDAKVSSGEYIFDIDAAEKIPL